MNLEPSGRAIGYDFLVEHYQIPEHTHWHHSRLAGSRTLKTDGVTVYETFPASFWPGETPWDHLEFALKYDGLHLGLLDQLFQIMHQAELIAYIQSKPTGIFCRSLWFLYEFLRQEMLPIPDAPKCNYVPILDPERYYAAESGARLSRYRIVNNFLGPREFCPLVRRTPKLAEMERANHPQQCRDLFQVYSPDLLQRALGYLFKKETKSSFAIEKEIPSTQRSDRFIQLLHLAEHDDFCTKSKLLELQNRIVDARFADADYRRSQNYVGQTIQFHSELIHYVCPKPEDLTLLMQGLVESNLRMGNGSVPPVIHAAILAYGFVFLHPFEDGNGRIHRFLIHNILARRGYTPESMIFPVSATMLKHSKAYDTSLEVFSKKVLDQVDYELLGDGRMVVKNETANLYRFMDLTPQAEGLSEFIRLTIQEELTSELEFLRHYDAARRQMEDVVDLPNRQLDLFMNLCLHGNGKLSATKRASHFGMLTEAEILGLEQAVRAGFEME